mgnify:CR=1 FL=1
MSRQGGILLANKGEDQWRSESHHSHTKACVHSHDTISFPPSLLLLALTLYNLSLVGKVSRIGSWASYSNKDSSSGFKTEVASLWRLYFLLLVRPQQQNYTTAWTSVMHGASSIGMNELSFFSKFATSSLLSSLSFQLQKVSLCYCRNRYSTFLREERQSLLLLFPCHYWNLHAFPMFWALTSIKILPTAWQVFC